MNAFPKTRRTIKLWQLLLAIVVVGVTLGLLPSQRVAIVLLLVIEAVLVIALLVLVVSGFVKRLRKDEHDT